MKKKPAKKKFTIEKKMVAQVRYYERLFIIRDEDGERVYTGADEKKARQILAVLTSYRMQQEKLKGKTSVKRKPKTRNRKPSRKS